MENLGYANGWKEIPEIVKQCREKHHKIDQRVTGRCIQQYTCHVCGYKYEVDSSD